MNRNRIYSSFLVVFLAMACPVSAQISCPEPAIADYTSYPVFQANTVEPNIMIILDNSGSMNEPAYNAGYKHTTKYYGYFEPYKRYTYSSNVFYRSSAGAWDGNFLNWATMRRVDVVRKVLMGGLATSRTGGGNQTNIGETSGSAYNAVQDFNQTSGTTDVPASVSPCPLNKRFRVGLSGGNFTFQYLDGTWKNVDLASYTIRVQKGKDINNVTLPDEDYLFLDNNIAGIMQRLWSKARFGLEFFNTGTGTRANGGIIPRVIGSSMTDMINNIQNQTCNTWTPLAEAYYTAIKYFKQESMEPAMNQANNVIPNSTAAQDPYNNPNPVHCAKSFVLLLTDGESTKDLFVPDYLKDYDGDGEDNITTFDSGTTPDGKMVWVSSTTKKFYITSMSGVTVVSGVTREAEATTFNTSYIGKDLVLYDQDDHQVYYARITDTYPSASSGTSAVMVSGTTNTTEWNSGAAKYGYDTPGYHFSWRVVMPAPNDETSGESNGSDYLDDLALYARTNDLRADLEGDQNLLLYTVYAFGNSATARNLLKNAAKNGGFEDKNGNRRPDLQSEWDEDGDGLPDTYYEASEGYQLESKLIKAINDILKRAASGTAVSVLATSGEGEGNLVQAYFRPSVTSGVTEVRWLGYLQSLWVDSMGNLREDSNANLRLDTDTDKVVVYFMDSAAGEAKIKRYDVSGASPYPDVSSGAYEVVSLESITPLWEAGKLLSQRTAESRNIFTYIDKDRNSAVNDAPNDPFDDTGEVIRFHPSSVDSIMPYLGIRDNTTWSYLGGTKTDRALNLIRYIRGQESGFSGTTGMQVRTRMIGSDVWKLGDIVHSTPVTISKPPDNYHMIYADESYQHYYNAFKNRETVVYVGANDGMLHAFTSWAYSGVSKQYTKPAAAPGTEQIGDEIWAYIPQSLLPHLKWLPSTSYTHVYYADLKPKIFDAKILPDDTHYTDDDTDDNWGTILLLGLNLGGKQICVNDVFTDASGVTVSETRQFYPTYTALDVTDPRNPRLLWERTYKDLGFSMSSPAVVRVKDKWFAVFGSGPTDYDGTSTKRGRVYVVDLKTGDGYRNASFPAGTTDAWLFEGSENYAFMNSPVSMDKELNYNVDGIYFGQTYYASNVWRGKIYKVAVPWDWTSTSTYQDVPNHSSNPWRFYGLFTTNNPITAPLALSIDFQDNVWAYFGTGRYLSQADKTSTQTQYLFGIKDPFFNSEYKTSPTNYYHDYTRGLVLDSGDLFNADPYSVMTDGSVFTGTSYFGEWKDLLAAARAEDGWKRTLSLSKERSITKFSILGGAVFAPSYIPNDDICGFGGDSWLYGLYFETGTAYYNPFLPSGPTDVAIGGNTYQRVDYKMSLGVGKSSALGIHVGQEAGAKAFIQQSTGAVLEAHVDTAFNIKSGLINWRQK
jgi:type IV pilus assembly protein PilY1